MLSCRQGPSTIVSMMLAWGRDGKERERKGKRGEGRGAEPLQLLGPQPLGE